MIRRHGQGLTLVEVLVVITLIAMMLLLTGSAQRMVGQVLHRAGERIAGFDDARMLPPFLRDLVESTSPVHLRFNDGSEPAPFFIGGAHELEWIGRLPVRYGVGGANFLRIAACNVSPGGQADTCLYWQPLTRQAIRPDWSRQAGHPLLTAPASLRFAYLGAQPRDWQSDWNHGAQLPEAVLMVIERDHAVLPVLVRLNAGAGGLQIEPNDMMGWQQIAYEP